MRGFLFPVPGAADGLALDRDYQPAAGLRRPGVKPSANDLAGHVRADQGERFFTPSLVSGSLEMKFSQFAVWNFLAGAVFVLSVGPAAYGAGKVSTGHHDPVSLGMLIGGIVVAAACIALVWHHHRRHKARRSGTSTPAGPTSPVHQSR